VKNFGETSLKNIKKKCI